ncbi:unnamed protein product [Taenia asiatica]|uniref:RING-type domain-containing protein n=1 Tax=Taenia asiatica TaxID=60517 RepID=A0A0R3VVM2_TAEAS|nr:unnamed protein product [Taenia asiatica]
MGRCKEYGEGGGGWHQVAKNLNVYEEIVCRASESRVSSLNKLGRKEEEMKGKLEQFGKQREREELELGATQRGTTKCVDDLICRLHQKQCVPRKDNQPQSSIEHPYSINTILDASKANQMRHCVPREDCLTRAEGQEEVESALRCVLASRQADKAQLAAQVAIEESKRMKAFECLQRQRDLGRRQVVDDILLAEAELSRLTQVERERKASQSALVVAHYSEHRRNLVRLLLELQHQKERRDLELHEFLKGLEEQRERDQTAYWLVQCQRLIDKKPWNLKKESLMDDDICVPLSALGASEHVSNLENHLPPTMSTSPTAENPSLDSLPVPSAPSEKENGGESTTGNTASSGITSPSAPPAIIARFENECCICQDAHCSIIFLPCGHVCCCKFCSAEVTLCPLCRNTVEQHIQLS